jgi:hypothetical protein
VREAARDFESVVGELEAGELEKLALTQRNRMRAVVVSVERWSEVEQGLAGARGVSGTQAARHDDPAVCAPSGQGPRMIQISVEATSSIAT